MPGDPSAWQLGLLMLMLQAQDDKARSFQELSPVFKSPEGIKQDASENQGNDRIREIELDPRNPKAPVLHGNQWVIAAKLIQGLWSTSPASGGGLRHKPLVPQQPSDPHCKEKAPQCPPFSI